MKIKDYGEKVKVEVCNLLYIVEETQEFEALHEAWDFVRDKVDNSYVKFHVRRDKMPNKRRLLKIVKVPADGTYSVQPDWAPRRSLNTRDEIYPVLSELVLTMEDNDV